MCAEMTLTLVGTVIVVFTARLCLHFEKLILVCGWCNRIRVKGNWVNFEEFRRMHGAETSHGICKECANKPEVGSADRI
jgi:hypothetical protein